MSTYIHFTDEQKEQARQTDLVSLLESQGETLKRSGKEFEWKDGSQKVTIRGNLFINMTERAVMLSTLSADSITNPTPKRWNICLAVAAVRLLLHRLS